MSETEFGGFDMKWAFHVKDVSQHRTHSLEWWNQYRKAYWDATLKRNHEPQHFPNGLHCPDCGGNLYDTMQQMTMHPPIELRVKCSNCKFKGIRYE